MFLQIFSVVNLISLGYLYKGKTSKQVLEQFFLYDYKLVIFCIILFQIKLSFITVFAISLALIYEAAIYEVYSEKVRIYFGMVLTVFTLNPILLMFFLNKKPILYLGFGGEYGKLFMTETVKDFSVKHPKVFKGGGVLLLAGGLAGSTINIWDNTIEAVYLKPVKCELDFHTRELNSQYLSNEQAKFHEEKRILFSNEHLKFSKKMWFPPTKS